MMAAVEFDYENIVHGHPNEIINLHPRRTPMPSSSPSYYLLPYAESYVKYYHQQLLTRALGGILCLAIAMA